MRREGGVTRYPCTLPEASGNTAAVEGTAKIGALGGRRVKDAFQDRHAEHLAGYLWCQSAMRVIAAVRHRTEEEACL